MSTKSIFCMALVCMMAVPAFADEGKFEKRHPRRAQVLNRANEQKNKNNAAAADGQITQKQANKLDRQDNRIKRQEQRDAREDGGHITSQQQAQLNREENHVTQERNGMEKRDAANQPGGSQAPTPPVSQ